ncbi:MAG: hypothetical protein OES69_02430 [Myxococcales bacterium]|nr:hypothetical protein [Myxococcales bacterium]
MAHDQPTGEPDEHAAFIAGYEPGRGGDTAGENEQRDDALPPTGVAVVDRDRGDAAPPPDEPVPPVYRQHQAGQPIVSNAVASDHTSVDRRIVHFRGYHVTRFGRTRFTEVVTICPAEQMWVGFTIDRRTHLWVIRAQYTPASDPFELLSNSDEPHVVDTYLRRTTRRRGIVRCLWGWREPPKHPDVWLCKRLLNIEISKATTPFDLYEFLAGQKPPHVARTKRQAAARTGRAMVAELVNP